MVRPGRRLSFPQHQDLILSIHFLALIGPHQTHMAETKVKHYTINIKKHKIYEITLCTTPHFLHKIPKSPLVSHYSENTREIILLLYTGIRKSILFCGCMPEIQGFALHAGTFFFWQFAKQELRVKE